MVSIIKDLSILRKFLFINLIVFIFIGILTIVYLKTIQPGLIKKKTSNHIRVIDNTIDRYWSVIKENTNSLSEKIP